MSLINCPECGKEISDMAGKCPSCGYPIISAPDITNPKISNKGFWSAGRLSIGIISIIMSVLISIQSCAVGTLNQILSNELETGSAGLGFSLFMLAAGIVGICTRNSRGKAGAGITCFLYYLSFNRVYEYFEDFPDLMIYGFTAISFGIVFLICTIKTNKYV